MLNEIEEFNEYTGCVNYSAKNKYDITYLGRFTYDMLFKFEGLARVLTFIARGYMFKNEVVDVDYARHAICAWCSVPDSKKASPKEDWQFKTDFSEYRSEFPELVDENCVGWFCNHVHSVSDFVLNNPNKVAKTAVDKCEKDKTGFNDGWQKKVIGLQISIFSSSTKGAWTLRFDDILADALELGKLKNKDINLPPELLEIISAQTPKGVPENVIPTLIKYYIANKQPDSDFVVLPISNFDAYFGTTSFSKKWLPKLPTELIERSEQSFGISRYKVKNIVL